MVLRSEVSFRVDSIVDANHGQGRSAFSFVRLDWMIQDDPNRPCIGWRLWAYTYWRALHFDLVMRLPRVGWRRA